LFLKVYTLRSAVFCIIRASSPCVALHHAEKILGREVLYIRIYHPWRIAISLSRPAFSLFGDTPTRVRPCQLILKPVTTVGICVFILLNG
jgi:hypothetical protein